MDDLVQRRMIEDRLKQKFEAQLSMRVSRELELAPPQFIPFQHFSYPLSECYEQFYSEHYFGCISLAQSLAEALVRFLCVKEFNGNAGSFIKNLNNLSKNKKISDDLVSELKYIWGSGQERNNFHHLNPVVEKDILELEKLSLGKVRSLTKVFSEIFRCSIVDGRIVPENRKYWDIKEGGIETFLN